jgi:hypothetical protein
VLKSDIKDEGKKVDEVTLIEQIEVERRQLDLTKCTPVTPETFAAWKEKQKAKKLVDQQTGIKEEMKARSKGRGNGFLLSPTHLASRSSSLSFHLPSFFIKKTSPNTNTQPDITFKYNTIIR